MFSDVVHLCLYVCTYSTDVGWQNECVAKTVSASQGRVREDARGPAGGGAGEVGLRRSGREALSSRVPPTGTSLW